MVYQINRPDRRVVAMISNVHSRLDAYLKKHYPNLPIAKRKEIVAQYRPFYLGTAICSPLDKWDQRRGQDLARARVRRRYFQTLMKANRRAIKYYQWEFRLANKKTHKIQREIERLEDDIAVLGA